MAVAAAVSPCSTWPLGNTQIAGSFFERTRSTRRQSSSFRKTMPPAWATRAATLSLLKRRLRSRGRHGLRLAFVDEPGVLGVVQVDDVEPHLQHVVDEIGRASCRER